MRKTQNTSRPAMMIVPVVIFHCRIDDHDSCPKVFRSLVNPNRSLVCICKCHKKQTEQPVS